MCHHVRPLYTLYVARVKYLHTSFLFYLWLKCYFPSCFILVSSLILILLILCFCFYFFLKCLIFFSILPLNQWMLFTPLFFCIAFGPHSFIFFFVGTFYQKIFFNFIVLHSNVIFPFIWFDFGFDHFSFNFGFLF